jgi:alginate O-acetyltransferase complex protein AlgI
VLGGLWHGAAWNFVLWGFYHGGLLCAHRYSQPGLDSIGQKMVSISAGTWHVVRIAFMFILTCYGWLLFRATSLTQVGSLTASLMQPFEHLPWADLKTIGWAILPLAVVQLLQYRTGNLQFMRQPWLPKELAAVVYAAMLYSIIFLGSAPQAFVYFQF